MPRLQFTTADYLAYLQMSNLQHVLVENHDKKRSIEGLLNQKGTNRYTNLFVDDVDFLVYFGRDLKNEEKVEHIFSDVVRRPYANKLVLVFHSGSLHDENDDGILLLPINAEASIAQRIDSAFSKIASRNVSIDHPSRVRSYLREHTDLIDLLPFISRTVSEGFIPDTEISLQVYIDPEFEDAYLAVFGRTEHYNEEFAEQIESIRAKYTELLTGKSGWILVTTDFGEPHQT